ncbi:UPF0496 protein 1-like [Magnolia sinica]|uniref:UPF0496 protein 1-like n=1 Tax=Magnolia sinica TaxID=86752 RepID=UPI00265B1FFF|nr:UPF0496 protein 1-like [Magnolia sinica]
MGGEFSKKTGESPLPIQTPGNLPYPAKELRSLSFDSFRRVSSSLLKMSHQEDPTMILERMKDVWKNPQLINLVKDYIDKGLHKSDFYMTLDKCLKWTHDSQLIIQSTPQHFEAEESGSTSNREKYLSMLDELKNFKAARDPFTEDFFQKLQLCKTNINKRLESSKRWRNVSCIIFASVFLAVVICAVVTSAVAVPPAGAALAAATALPLVTMIQWLHSRWKDSDVALEEQKEMISSMWAGTFVAIEHMNSIQPLVDKLKIEIEQLLQFADDSPIDKKAARFETEEIKKKLGVFTKSLEDFGNHINCCIQNIGIRSKEIVQKMIKDPR